MTRLLRLAALPGVALVVSLFVAVPTAQADDTITKSCENPEADCGDFPTPEEIPPETPCKILVDGYWLEGETNDQGQCVCEFTPEDTTTTVEDTTVPTTEVTAPTTEEPTTAPEESTTTVQEVAPSSTSTTSPEFVAQPTGSGQLPRTGSSTTLPLAFGGVGLLLLGMGLVAVRNRLVQN